MALCPFAVRRLIPPGSSDPRITARVAILHVDAGNTRDLYDYFAHRSGGIESHFQIAKDGTIFQYRDTDYQADANNDANDFGVSIETQGLEFEVWTEEQIASIKRLLLWLAEVEPAFELQRVTGPYGTGVGYHTQFGAPGPWTPVSKSCPGPNRKKQYESIIVPWLSAGAAPIEREDITMDKSTKDYFDAQFARSRQQVASVKKATKAALESIEVLTETVATGDTQIKARITKSKGEIKAALAELEADEAAVQ